MGGGLSNAVIGGKGKKVQNPIVGYPVFWINLDRSVDCRQRMHSALEAAGIVATRVPAVDARKFDPLDQIDCVTLPPPNSDYAYPKFLIRASTDRPETRAWLASVDFSLTLPVRTF